MTNGEKLCIVFPNMGYVISGHRVITTIGVANSFDLDWWNAKYQEPSSSGIPTGSDDCISRADALALFCDKCSVYNCISKCSSYRAVKKMPSVTPQEPRCKECKWWKDSDGAFRRGIGAESQCPINTQAVYCGEGYCYKFSPKADNREVEE